MASHSEDFLLHMGSLPRNDSGSSLQDLVHSPSRASLSRSDSGCSLPSAPTATTAIVIKVAIPVEEPAEGKASQAPDGHLPIRAVITLCMAQVAHFYSMCSVFSYAGFMAVDCGWVSDADRAGYVAGERLTAHSGPTLPAEVQQLLPERWPRFVAQACWRACFLSGGFQPRCCGAIVPIGSGVDRHSSARC